MDTSLKDTHMMKVEIGEFTIFKDRSRVKIGDGTRILTHCYFYEDVTLGKNTLVGHHCTLRPGTIIGDGTRIGSYGQLEGHLTIGKDCRFHSDVHICIGSRIGDRVFIAPRTTFLNTLHPFCPEAKNCIRAPVIEDDVKIGANCSIGPNIRIGRGSLVGSSTNVIKDIPPFSLAVGNPARIVKDVRDIKCPFEQVGSFKKGDRPYANLNSK